jgi:hypothetical protein
MSIRGSHMHVGNISDMPVDHFRQSILEINKVDSGMHDFMVPGTMEDFRNRLGDFDVDALRCLGGGFELRGTDEVQKFHAEGGKVDNVNYVVFSRFQEGALGNEEGMENYGGSGAVHMHSKSMLHDAFDELVKASFARM